MTQVKTLDPARSAYAVRRYQLLQQARQARQQWRACRDQAREAMARKVRLEDQGLPHWGAAFELLYWASDMAQMTAIRRLVCLQNQMVELRHAQ
jgi:hypothetical protein